MGDTYGPLGHLTIEQVAQLQRIEEKLDTLLEALAEPADQADAPALALDGSYAGQERPVGTPL